MDKIRSNQHVDVPQQIEAIAHYLPLTWPVEHEQAHTLAQSIHQHMSEHVPYRFNTPGVNEALRTLYFKRMTQLNGTPDQPHHAVVIRRTDYLLRQLSRMAKYLESFHQTASSNYTKITHRRTSHATIMLLSLDLIEQHPWLKDLAPRDYQRYIDEPAYAKRVDMRAESLAASGFTGQDFTRPDQVPLTTKLGCKHLVECSQRCHLSPNQTLISALSEHFIDLNAHNHSYQMIREIKQLEALAVGAPMVMSKQLHFQHPLLNVLDTVACTIEIMLEGAPAILTPSELLEECEQIHRMPWLDWQDTLPWKGDHKVDLTDQMRETYCHAMFARALLGLSNRAYKDEDVRLPALELPA